MKRQYLTAADLRKLPRPHDFVEGVLYERCMSVWAGAPKSGKSYLLLNLAHAVACGTRWAGRCVDKGNVLMIPLEGVGMLHDRVRAWEMETGQSSPLIFSPTPLNLLTDDEAITEIVEYVRENQIRLVVLDTLARATAGGNESSFEDMSIAIAALDRIKDEGGAHIAVVHHSGYSRSGPRGSSDIVAAPDLIVEIKRIKGTDERHALISENRHGKDGETLRFTLEPAKTDIVDSRGNAVFSAIVKMQGDWFDDVTIKAEQAELKLTGSEQAALAILSKRAKLLGPLPREDARKALSRAAWGPKGKGAKAEAAWRQAFGRLLKSLEKKGALEIDSNGEFAFSLLSR